MKTYYEESTAWNFLGYPRKSADIMKIQQVKVFISIRRSFDLLKTGFQF